MIFSLFIAVPALIGFILTLPIWVFYPLFVRLRTRPRTSNGMAVSIGVISILVVMSLYTWVTISTAYAITIPSSKDWEIRQKYEKAAVLEAWLHTIIPPPFQKSCYSGEEIVCQLAEGVRMRIWNWPIDYDDLPWLSGLVAGITSTITVKSMFWSVAKRANSVLVDSTA